MKALKTGFYGGVYFTEWNGNSIIRGTEVANVAKLQINRIRTITNASPVWFSQV